MPMSSVFVYIKKNCKWIFSGIGVAIITAAIALARPLFVNNDRNDNNDITNNDT